jgi:hypothetical protein
VASLVRDTGRHVCFRAFGVARERARRKETDCARDCFVLVDRSGYRVVGTHVRAAALDKLIHELARARGLNNARLRAGKSHNQITETLNRSLHGRRRGRNAMDATGGARA